MRSREFLRNRQARGFLPDSVLVRSSTTSHNTHPRTEQGTSTPVLSVEGSLLDPLLLILRHNNIERPVQTSLRRTQPFYPHVDGAPLRFDALALPFADRLQVERPAIPEVQTRPQLGHSGGVYAR